MKLSFVFLLCLSLFTVHTGWNRTQDVLNPLACTESCTTFEDVLESEEKTENNTLILRYQSGVEVEKIHESEWVIRDYPNVFQAEIPNTSARSSVSIGLAILKYANYALTACQAIQYVTGHDVCRIVLSYLTTPHGNGTYTYELTGTYRPGYIPGCEPAHSLPCNSGYWEYRVVLK